MGQLIDQTGRARGLWNIKGIGCHEEGLVRSELLESVGSVVKPDAQFQAGRIGKEGGGQVGHAGNAWIAQGDRVKAAFDVEGQVGGGFAGRALVVPDEVASRIHEGEPEGPCPFEGFARDQDAPLVRKRGPLKGKEVPEKEAEKEEEDGFVFHSVVWA